MKNNRTIQSNIDTGKQNNCLSKRDKHILYPISIILAFAVILTTIAICLVPSHILSSKSTTEQTISQIEFTNSSPIDIPYDVQKENQHNLQTIIDNPAPIGWTITQIETIPTFSSIKVIYAPQININTNLENNATLKSTTTTNKQENIQSEQEQLVNTFSELIGLCEQNEIIIQKDREILKVSADNILINLPDIMQDAKYDIQYSYSAPSRCVSENIEGLTGQVVDGYCPKSYNMYLQKEEYALPCALNTATKLISANNTLKEQGYMMYIWDVYRPYRASKHISNTFKNAYNTNSIIRNSISGGWSLSWYVADGASGHNFATDIDLTLCDLQGNIIDMPSHFDAFDASAHLTHQPISTQNITENQYTKEVKENNACMFLHRVMKQSGFSELASEWWHLSDNNTKRSIQDIVGKNGMNFVAQNPS